MSGQVQIIEQSDAMQDRKERWRLLNYSFHGGHALTAKSTVSLELDDLCGQVVNEKSTNPCQLEAYVQCARIISGCDFTLRSFEVRTDFTDIGRWTEGELTLIYNAAIIRTYSNGNNLLDAYVKALVRALNIIAP